MDNQNNVQAGGLLSKLLKPVVLIPTAAVVVAVAVGTGIGVAASSDKAVANSAINDLSNSIYDVELVSILKDSSEQGRITLAVGSGDILPTDARLDVWMSSDKSKFAAKASMVGEDAALYFSDTDLVATTSILGDAYGVSLKDLKGQLEKSELLSDLLEELDEDVLDQLDGLSEKIKDMKKTGKEGAKYLDKYYKLFFEAIFDNADVESQRDSGNKVITITVDEECLANSLVEVWKKAGKDKKLISYLEKNFDMELLSDGTFADWKELLNDDDVLDEIESISKEDFEVELEITASSVAHNFKKLKVSIKVDGEKVVATLDQTEKNDTKFKITAGGRTIVSAKLTRDGDNLKGSLEAMGETVGSFKWTYDKKAKTFKLEISIADGVRTIAFKGDYESKSKRFYLKVDKLTITEVDGSETVLEVNASLEIVVGEKIPDAPKKYENVLELTEENVAAIEKELEEWAIKFMESDEFKALVGAFGGRSYGIAG